MAGLGVVICSYNMLGIQMHVGQTKQFLKVRSKKIRTQHNYKKSDPTYRKSFSEGPAVFAEVS